MEGGAGRVVREVAGHIEDDVNRVGGAGRPVHGVELATASEGDGYAVGPDVRCREVDGRGSGLGAAGERRSDGDVAVAGLTDDGDVAGDRDCSGGYAVKAGHRERLLGPRVEEYGTLVDARVEHPAGSDGVEGGAGEDRRGCRRVGCGSSTQAVGSCDGEGVGAVGEAGDRATQCPARGARAAAGRAGHGIAGDGAPAVVGRRRPGDRSGAQTAGCGNACRLAGHGRRRLRGDTVGWIGRRAGAYAVGGGDREGVGGSVGKA